MIKGIIFDLGGVLLRTEDRTPRQQLAEDLGVTVEQLYDLIFNSESAHLATLGEVTSEQHWESIQQKMKWSAAELSEVRSKFWSGDRLDMLLIDYLRQLRAGRKTALLSNAWDDLRNFIEEQWKFGDAFDEIIISAEVGAAKPSPEIYLLALQRLGLHPQEAVFVDDVMENLVGAQAVGLHTIHFTGSQSAINQLADLMEQQECSSLR